MHKLKLPTYPQTTKWSLVTDSNTTSADQKMLGHLEVVRSSTSLIKISPYSKTLYTEWLLEPDCYKYNMLSADQVLHGNLDVKRLRAALNRYVAEHVLLNSHIQVCNEEPYWVKNTTISELEYSTEPESETELLSYVQQPFDLYTGPLYRFKLLRLSESKHRFIIVLHHLVMDGISINTGVFDAISNYYNHPDYTAKFSVPTQINLLNILEKKLSRNLDENKKEYKTFWQKQLADIENIDLSFLHVPSENLVQQDTPDCNPIAEVRFSFDSNILNKLTRVSAQYQLTPYIYSQCIFAILLHKYTSQQHFAINYPISIREGADFIYGSQVNLNLISYQFVSELTPITLLNYVRDFYANNIKNKMQYGHCPIPDILQTVDNNKQLLQVAFAQAHFRDKLFRFFGIEKTESIHTLNVDGVTENSLIFEQEATREKLNYRVKFDRTSINPELLDAFINSYKKLFIDVLKDLTNGNNNKLITDYSLLSAEQYQQLVDDFNQTEKYLPQKKTIHQLFEEQSAKTPNNIAIVYEDEALTYQELNQRANQLARYIKHTYSIQPEDLIALYLDKSELTIIAILAVLKCGAAYVPIDPNYPLDRIRYILDDTGAKAMVINERYEARLNNINKHTSFISLDSKQLMNAICKEEKSNLSTNFLATNLAYVLYTSGTTGQPKGVSQQHDSVVSLLQVTEDLCQFNVDDVWLVFHSYVFDVNVWEMWGALIYGGKLIIPNNNQLSDFEELFKLCQDTKVTVINQTPSAFYLFSEIALKNNDQYLKNLRYVILAGEKLNFMGLKPWLTSSYGDTSQVVNMYGITELTILSTHKIITKDDFGNRSCIGHILAGQSGYILDSNLSVLPIGAVGELHIGGERLARGYLNKPTLTQERFIPNPFQTEEEKILGINSRLYKTGDLVRRLPEGELEYIARNDSQVKIRGYRIELGAIEATLTKFPGISQAVVVLKTESDNVNMPTQYLVAYYLAKEKLNEIKIREYLVQHLSSYMCPSILVHLTSLPLTINGKINIKALPTPTFTRNTIYVAPSNSQEQLICETFATILGTNPVSVTDDFFELGGDSLKAIKLTAQLQAYFSIKVSDIFSLHTPQNIAKHVPFAGNVLIQRLNEVKQSYAQQELAQQHIEAELKQQEESYLASIKENRFDRTLTKSISNILLTGATGFLGCNLLYQLLKLTDHIIFIHIRAETKQKAIERIQQKFKFYFEDELTHVIEKRVFILNGDLELPLLGLPENTYKELVSKIDSIVHAAAITKHYGAAESFYSANVQATIHLLELAKQTKCKDFHYISTTSVLNFTATHSKTACLGTEYDAPDELLLSNNIYIKTKQLAEKQVMMYRAYGVKSNIYRIGNLTIHSENFRSQENLHENAFANWLQGLLSMKCIASEISSVEMSQVDLTAQAVVKLFNQTQFINNIYHVFNPNLINLADVFTQLKVLPMDRFIDHIVNIPSKDDDSNSKNELMLKFSLRQGWLEKSDDKRATTVKLMQTKTAQILQQLNFNWTPITGKQLNAYVNQKSGN
jgi:surfactin family lipopeptide synthetase A